MPGAQIDALREEIRAAYKRFVGRVAIGRGLKRDEVHQLGRGRIFTGEQARAVQLVDSVGSLEDAYARIAERTGIARAKLLVEYHQLEKQSFLATVTGRGESLERVSALWPKQWLHAPQVCMVAQRNPILAYCDVVIDEE